jgi:hypothetical protein
MKTQIHHLNKKIFENLDVILGGICALCGAGITYLSLIGRINQLLIGITLISCALMYLLVRSRLTENFFQNFHLHSRQKEMLTILFCVLIIIASVLWYNQIYSRPFIYFLVVSFLAGLLSVEILLFTKEDNVWPVLIKIFFMTFVMRMGIYYNFPSIMGVDAYFHTNMANIIATTGIVPPFEISEKYIHYPILHILIAITKIVSFISIKDAVFFSIGIMSIVCTLFLFIFVNRYAGPRVGLLSTLIFCITTQIIVTGITNITPGSLVLCYFLMLLCLLIDHNRHPYTLLLCLIIMFTIVITHQLSSFVAFVSLCLFAFCLLIFEQVFGGQNKKITFKLFLALFGITMIFYWIYTPLYQNVSFFEGVLAPFIDFLTSGGTYGNDFLITGHNYYRPYFETLMLQISYLILPFFGIAGIFFWVSRKHDIKFSIAITSGTLFFIIYAFPLLGSRNLLTDRWMPFLFIFLGIVAAAFILSSVELIKSNSAKFVTIFVILTLVTFFMIVPPEINKDNPLVAKNQTVRNQFKNNEIDAAGTLSLIHGKRIITDSSYQSQFIFPGSDNLVSGFLYENQLLEYSKRPGSIIVLRKSTLIEPVSLRASELYADVYDDHLSKTTFEFFETAKNRNLIYTNGNIIGYQSNVAE